MVQPQSAERLQSQSLRISVRNQAGLVVARTGTTDTAVLSFAAGTVTEGADSIEAVSTAANGTVVRIRTSGRYVCEIGAIKIADADTPITFGFSVDVDAAGLAAVPAFATAGMLAVVPIAAPAAALVNVPFLYTTEIDVSAEQARQVVSGVQGAQVRFHAFGAAAAPAAGLGQTPAWFAVRWVGPSNAP